MINRLTSLLLLGVCGPLSCASQQTSEAIFETVEAQAAYGVGFCQKEYLKLSGKKSFFAPADRAYVLVFYDQMDILFTSGAMGLYEDRSKSYRSYLFCSLLGGDNLTVQSLMPTQAESLLGNEYVPEIVDLGDENGPVSEAIFLRRNDDFYFWKRFDFETIGTYKNFSSEKLDKY